MPFVGAFYSINEAGSLFSINCPPGRDVLALATIASAMTIGDSGEAER